MFDECRLRRFHHLHRTTGVNLVFGKIRKIGQYGFVHEAGAAGPLVFRQRLRQHGNKSEIGMIARPLLRQITHIEITAAAHAPVQNHGAIQSVMEGMFQHALDRREAG